MISAIITPNAISDSDLIKKRTAAREMHSLAAVFDFVLNPAGDFKSHAQLVYVVIGIG